MSHKNKNSQNKFYIIVTIFLALIFILTYYLHYKYNNLFFDPEKDSKKIYISESNNIIVRMPSQKTVVINISRCHNSFTDLIKSDVEISEYCLGLNYESNILINSDKYTIYKLSEKGYFPRYGILRKDKVSKFYNIVIDVNDNSLLDIKDQLYIDTVIKNAYNLRLIQDF